MSVQISELADSIWQGARDAKATLEGVVRKTPFDRNPMLEQRSGAEVWIKQENLQLTRSCKARSAYFMVKKLAAQAQVREVATASTGNNGIAMSWAAGQLGLDATVFLPHTVDPHKASIIQQQGATVVLHGQDIIDSEAAARAYGDECKVPYRSPYNDVSAVHAQATIALEMMEQMEGFADRVDHVIVPVGGGGLISGIGGLLRARGARARVIGVQPENSAIMASSVAAGRILDLPSKATLSNATAGGVEAGSVTFDYCRELVDEFVLISEDELAQAMVLMHRNDIVLEGSGALAVAALLRDRDRFRGQTVALVLCGANVAPEQFSRLRQSC